MTQRFALVFLFLGCRRGDGDNAPRVEYLGGKPPIACIASVGSGSDEPAFTTCRDAAGVIFVCDRDLHPDCVRVARVQAVWSAGLPEIRP